METGRIIAIAITEDYTKNIEGGCGFLWTDFGFPMCSKDNWCFLAFKNKNETFCSENKKFKRDRGYMNGKDK